MLHANIQTRVSNSAMHLQCCNCPSLFSLNRVRASPTQVFFLVFNSTFVGPKCHTCMKNLNILSLQFNSFRFVFLSGHFLLLVFQFVTIFFSISISSFSNFTTHICNSSGQEFSNSTPMSFPSNGVGKKCSCVLRTSLKILLECVFKSVCLNV